MGHFSKGRIESMVQIEPYPDALKLTGSFHFLQTESKDPKDTMPFYPQLRGLQIWPAYVAMGVRESFKEEVLGAAAEERTEGERTRRTDVHNSTREIVYAWARED